MAQINPLVTTAVQTTIANLYIALLGRNPDQGGFTFWTTRLASNGNTSAAVDGIARGFAGSPEFVNTYGNQSVDSAISLMYTNLFSRPADPEGLAFWVSQASAKIAASTPIGDALALTVVRMIAIAGINNTSDTALITARQIAAIAAGNGIVEVAPIEPPVIPPIAPPVGGGSGGGGGGGAPVLNLTGS